MSELGPLPDPELFDRAIALAVRAEPWLRTAYDEVRDGPKAAQIAYAERLQAFHAALGRSCGSCSLCCKLLYVEELKKAEARWCPHCKPTSPEPCRIYLDRPATCRLFLCGWLTGMGPEELKPTQSRVVINAETFEGGRPGLRLHVDPAVPDALSRKAMRRFVHAAHRNGYIIVVEMGQKRYAIPPAGTQEIEMRDANGEIWISGTLANLP